MNTQTATKEQTSGERPIAEEKGAVAVFQPPRLPYHKAIEDRFGVSPSAWKALVEAVFPTAKSVDSVIMALSYCKARNLDPFKRPVHIVPMWDSRTKGMVETIWPGISELRTTAFRTGNYAGCDEAEFGPSITRTFSGRVKTENGWTDKSVEVTFPEWCRITLYRDLGGRLCKFVGPKVLWLEAYATIGNSELPNDMWQSRPEGQLEKCFDPETEVLTDAGFQPFSQVTARILQVTSDGRLEATDEKPFSQHYDGEMIALHSRDLDFVVTPNHDLLTTAGKIEAGTVYSAAQTKARFWIPRCISGSSCEYLISDADIRLAAAFLADGFDGHGGKLAFKVSRPAKRQLLMGLGPISVIPLENAGAEAIAIGGRVITTRHAQTLYEFNANRVATLCDVKKRVAMDALMRLSRRQARLFVDTWLACDGSRNKKTGVRRVYTSRPEHAAAFEVAAILAGLSVSDRKSRTSDIGTRPNLNLTVSERSEIGLIRWGKQHSRSKGNAAGRTGLELERNPSGRVWCVTVLSGVIVVRRHGFSMLCGNCAEAASLRKAFPEEIGNELTSEEMAGRMIRDELASNSVPAKTPPRADSVKGGLPPPQQQGQPDEPAEEGEPEVTEGEFVEEGEEAGSDHEADEAWLSQLAAEFNKCNDMVSFGLAQRDHMAPKKKIASTEAWAKAQALAEDTYRRIQKR